jgi:hypothetical protein
VEIPAADREALTKGAAELKGMIEELRGKSKERDLPSPGKKGSTAPMPLPLSDLLPDVEIFHKSVDWALRYNQFNNVKEVKIAHEQLAEGKKRAEALKNGEAPWTKQKGLVVRAYRSKIDGSVQPYGMVIPESYTGGAPTRLDFWIHGRGETLSELAFVDQRMKQSGQIQPKDALVLHLYGRYCCANKFAGEVDLFEALDHAKKFYRIDDDRLIVRGFSMGGASAWQFGTHFAGKWCAVSPGAGFAETPEFLGGYQSEDVSGAPEYQKTLWHLYNSSDYALNLFNVPTISYSGEIDKQRQAADVMDRELKKEGLNLLQIIGPQTAHKLHPDSLVEIEKRLADIVALGRIVTPREVHFTTWTLRYNEMAWLKIDAMGGHWKRARVDAVVKDDSNIQINTQNVREFTIAFPPGRCPLSLLKNSIVVINGESYPIGAAKSDRSLEVHFAALPMVDEQFRGELPLAPSLTEKQPQAKPQGNNEKLHANQEISKANRAVPALLKTGDKWVLREQIPKDSSLDKRHGLQGPIDDAFWDSFLFVTPTGPALNPAVEKWVGSELPRAVREWQKQFRGEAPQKKDSEIKDDDIAKNNLVLWGDSSSNAILKKIADKLPIKWTADSIEVGGKKYAAGEHVPLMIYPNPLNPNKYVVLNSGFTYREYDYLNNARQVPKLPDWAIVNLSEPPNAVSPGKVVAADFFDEQWALKKK